MKILFIMSILFSLLNKNYTKKIVGKHHVLPTILKPFTINDCVNVHGNQWLCNGHTLYLKDNEFINDKKLISISPGGFKGFYMLGIASFIKENYNLQDYIFSGASAGAWNSLFMTFKHDPLELALDIVDDKTNNAISIIDLEYIIKYKILEKYTKEDFELKKLFIGVTSFEKIKVKTHIFSDFDTLEDALNCCIASSHIPYVTSSNFLNKYQNINTFDGGFSTYPYLNVINPTLHITPSMWEEPEQKQQNNQVQVQDQVHDPKNNNNRSRIKNFLKKIFRFPPSFHVSDYTTLFSKNKYNLYELYDKGYNDAKKNKELLDEIFLHGNNL